MLKCGCPVVRLHRMCMSNRSTALCACCSVTLRGHPVLQADLLARALRRDKPTNRTVLGKCCGVLAVVATGTTLGFMTPAVSIRSAISVLVDLF
jgi:hypothetical protein